MLCNNILDAVGRTPLVRLNRINQGLKPQIYVKADYTNPGGSVKDRIGITMIDDAEKRGLLKPGGTIIEGTSGNTGMGLAIAAVVKGYKCVFTTTDKQSKEKIDVFSFELLAYRELVNPNAQPGATNDAERLPDYFIASDDVTPKEHVEVQAAAQKWVDSSISKTANVPTNFAYDKFKDIYLYAHEQGLKGCTTFRFNPEAFQGVLVKEQDLKNTIYKFTLDDGTVIEARGDEEIEYDGELHTTANLYDSLKEGYFGKY